LLLLLPLLLQLRPLQMLPLLSYMINVLLT
jgi:hypothetical protein